MKAKSGFLALTALVAMVVAGCSGHPAGFMGPRALTDAEKETVAELGTKAAGLPAWVETKVDPSWTVIIWSGSREREIHYLPADVTLAKAVEGVTSSAVWYPAAIVSAGDEWTQVTVDLSTRKVIDVWTPTHSAVPPER